MKGMLLLALLGCGLLCGACKSSSVRDAADLILLNGAVYTVDPALPWAEAVAVKEGRILAVGSSKEIRALAGGETEIVDLTGTLLLPGFIDSHTHFLNGGFSLADIQLRDADSREAISRVRRCGSSRRPASADRSSQANRAGASRPAHCVCECK